jgi:hypothetical protein
MGEMVWYPGKIENYATVNEIKLKPENQFKRVNLAYAYAYSW